MTTYKNSSELDKLPLGKPTSYECEYNPKLLQAVPRILNRDELNVKDNNLPFIGEDVWYGYELSWLNDKGKPVVAVAEFRFPCQSPCIVESKSFKLYLNSFNQSKFCSWQHVKEHLINDLSKTSGMITQVTLYPVNVCPPLTINDSSATCLDELDVTIDNYQLSPNILKQSNSKKDKTVTESLVSHLLKSNCLITNQPDWASIYISYTGKAIIHSSLLKYLISFRQHNEFHEQCVERIFCDIKRHCDISELTVFARYTRRGGLDINPFRSTSIKQAPSARTLRQ
jgi:7-cyano-7-deazaguanine reductase